MIRSSVSEEGREIYLADFGRKSHTAMLERSKPYFKGQKTEGKSMNAWNERLRAIVDISILGLGLSKPKFELGTTKGHILQKTEDKSIMGQI